MLSQSFVVPKLPEQVYDRDFVIDYNSYERNDLMVFSPDYYEQKHLYTAWGERTEMFTDRTPQSDGNGGLQRLLYVHEDIMGNTRYYTKDNGQSFAELEYDVWGAPTSPSKLVNNDNGNFAAAVFTGHPYDTLNYTRKNGHFVQGYSILPNDCILQLKEHPNHPLLSQLIWLSPKSRITLNWEKYLHLDRYIEPV